MGDITLLSKLKVPVNWIRVAVIVFLAAFLVLLGVYHYFFWRIGYDWVGFHPGTLRLLIGLSPYDMDWFGIFSPPWALLLLAPMAALPIKVGGAVLFVVSIVAIAYAARKMGASPIGTLAILLSFPVYKILLHGQIDWMVMLGFVLPPQFDLFLVLVKPQIGFGIALFWAVDIWKRDGLRKVIMVFAPVTIAYLLSFAVYGPYILRGQIALSGDWNWTMWPMAIPVGVVLLYRSIQTRNKHLSILASPFLSPYVPMYSWSIPLLGLVDNTLMLVLVSASTWLVSWLR